MAKAKEASTQVFAAIDRLLSGTPAAVVGDGALTLARELRKRLAVRWWVNPHKMIDGGVEQTDLARALNIVSVEAEAVLANRPGDWYLSTAARRRVLATLSLTDLATELGRIRSSQDAKDPVRAALRIALGLDPMPDLASASDPILRSLVQATDWLEGRSKLGQMAQRVATELSTRAHRADIERMTQSGLVGEQHRHALYQLLGRLTAAAPQTLEVSYLYGAGGSGKSTVLAFLERALAQQPNPPAVIRLDFDDPLINPMDPVSLDLALVAQLGRLDPENASRVQRVTRGLRDLQKVRDEERYGDTTFSAVRKARVKSAGVQSSGLESAYSEERSWRHSLLRGVFGSTRSVVIILDTVEVLAGHGETATIELVGWLNDLARVYGAETIGLVLAGRDPPQGRELALLDRLDERGLIHPAIHLADLTVADAKTLLRNFGVEDQDDIEAAAEALPRNPLLLRIAAEALVAEPGLTEGIRGAHRAARVDHVSASIYLGKRVLAHIADPFARPFILGALVLPQVTRAQLREIVIPICGGDQSWSTPTKTADRLFRALKATRWLVSNATRRGVLTFHRDVRALVLKLIAADPDYAGMARNIHERAIDFHGRRRQAQDRAFGFYHAAMIGLPVLPVARADVIARHLREVADDLPADVRAYLMENRDRQRQGLYRAARSEAYEWRDYLEGVRGRDGEGDRLLKRDRAEDALRLYRERPTQPPGLPPTFVIRALADTGDWDAEEVSLDGVFEQIWSYRSRGLMSGNMVSRLYWVLRLALLRGNARIDHRHGELIHAVCERPMNTAISSLTEVVAVAEASLGYDLLNARMLSEKGGADSVTRARLVSGWRGRPTRPFNPRIDALIVVQENWLQELHSVGADEFVDIGRLRETQDRIWSLHNQPIALINARLRVLRSSQRVTWMGQNLEAGVLLLRGQTTEFLRPLRQGIAEALADRVVAPRMMEIMKIVARDMSIRPMEFQPDQLEANLHRDALTWSSAFVGFADRCRLLPHLCALLTRLPGDGPATRKVRRIAGCFLDWDEAICGGRRSGWRGAASLYG